MKITTSIICSCHTIISNSNSVHIINAASANGARVLNRLQNHGLADAMKAAVGNAPASTDCGEAAAAVEVDEIEDF